MNEKEKKKTYNHRLIQIEHSTFTPLIFSATGGMGRECKKFYHRLAEKISEKRKIEFEKISIWIRRKISFALMRTAHMCIRGSRGLGYHGGESSDHIELDPEASELLAKI